MQISDRPRKTLRRLRPTRPPHRVQQQPHLDRRLLRDRVILPPRLILRLQPLPMMIPQNRRNMLNAPPVQRPCRILQPPPVPPRRRPRQRNRKPPVPPSIVIQQQPMIPRSLPHQRHTRIPPPTTNHPLPPRTLPQNSRPRPRERTPLAPTAAPPATALSVRPRPAKPPVQAAASQP